MSFVNYHIGDRILIPNTHSRRQRLDERAAQHIDRNSPQYQNFLNLNSDFAKGSVLAKDVVIGYVDLFKTDINEVTLLIHEFAELFTEGKNSELLAALNEWRTRVSSENMKRNLHVADD